MNSVFPSSGSLLPPRAPVTGLAGLSILRTPRQKTGLGARGSGLGKAKPFPRRGLGAGSAEGQQIGATIMSTAALTGPAAPIVAGVGELVSLISSFVGGGCGSACVQAAEAEQIYEYAGQCLDAVAAAGMLGQNDLLTGLETILNAGVQHMQALASDPKAAAGTTNLQKTLGSDITGASQYPPTAPNALNITQAQTLFPGTSGWYASSASAGAQLALAYLNSVPSAAASTSTATGVVSSIATAIGLPATVTIAGVSLSSSTILIGVAIVAGLLYFQSKGD
jgi:hypothetical protein